MCMIFNPKCRTKICVLRFPNILFNNRSLQFASEFRYPGHINNNEFKEDDDIKQEIRNLFVRTNLLLRRFSKCSVEVKPYCLIGTVCAFYDAALWTVCHTYSMVKLKSA